MNTNHRSPHKFHIPVMGTSFTIDTPIRIAKYGISSAISLVDDILIEQVRKYHCERIGEPYVEVPKDKKESRARRITLYLNLIKKLVDRGFERLRSSKFEEGSEITRYFNMLPRGDLRERYKHMLSIEDTDEKVLLQEELRNSIRPGSIDVNIMTKLDRMGARGNEDIPYKYSDASLALRGYALSDLRSTIIFSAGLNPRLYSSIKDYDDFLPDENGELKKKIALKVSDFRSAFIQGKFLAKRRLWVSEFRFESGLNCGGHAFATKGLLLGTILEEFKARKAELLEKLHSIYVESYKKLGQPPPAEAHRTIFTVQGGIGTASEDEFLRKRYGMDGTGWGTPFLLVPDIINIDEIHLKKLSKAGKDDVLLSDSSPIGLPFWILRNSASEENKFRKVNEGNPGSACPKGFLITNTEFTKHKICLAAKNYVKKKMTDIPDMSLSEKQEIATREGVLAKTCICHDLGGSVSVKLGIDPKATPTICCGPNIVNFSKVTTLEEMVGHIYGRISLLMNSKRPHMFIKELSLYIDYFRKEIEAFKIELSNYTPKYFEEVKKNLLEGIEYYQRLSEEFLGEQKTRFLEDLSTMRQEFEELFAEFYLELETERV